MSSIKFQLTLSDKAREDFRYILSYTLQMWGERQMQEYGNILHEAMSRIKQTPETGKILHPYWYVKKQGSILFFIA